MLEYERTPEDGGAAVPADKVKVIGIGGAGSNVLDRIALEGMEEAELPGGLEWQWERENSRDGVPVSPEHQEDLEGIAVKLGVETGFEEYEHTRF